MNKKRFKYKICVLVGTRPEAIKLAPVIKEIKKKRDLLDLSVIVTAQHREMLDQALRLFSIKPDYDLDIMRPGQSLFDVTTRALSRLKPVLEKENPDLLVVQGDTTTVLIGALAAFYLKIPIAHVEAGLRTEDKYQPFPEEINRRVATVLADLHFAPTKLSMNNLLREGVKRDRIYVTGNTVVDAMLSVLDKKYRLQIGALKGAGLSKKRIVLITMHRRENWGRPLIDTCGAVKKIIKEYDDVAVIFSVHPNPAVQKAVHRALSGIDRVYLLKPLGYKDFVNLMAKAYVILTDSGGIQEEAPLLGKPVFVLRNVTERKEAVLSGSARLVGTDPANITNQIRRILTSRASYGKMTRHNPYGTGRAGKKIVRAILKYLKTLKPTIHRPVESIESPLT